MHNTAKVTPFIWLSILFFYNSTQLTHSNLENLEVSVFKHALHFPFQIRGRSFAFVCECVCWAGYIWCRSVVMVVVVLCVCVCVCVCTGGGVD